MKKLKKWWRDFRDVTPPEWKRLMTTSASLAAALTAGWLVVPSLNVALPEEWGKYVAIAVAVLTAVSVYAKSHAPKEPQNQDK